MNHLKVSKNLVPLTVLLLLTAVVLPGCAHKNKYRHDKPGMEHISAEEKQTNNEIIDLLSGHLKEQYAGQAFLRDTHPKSNGCMHAQMSIDEGIDPQFRHGIFAQPKTYNAWLRFSNSAPEVTHDYDKDFRGLGIKLFDIEGERLPEPGDETHTQDFLFIGFPAFFAGHPKDFHAFFDAAFNRGRVGTAGYFLKRPKALRNTLKGRQRFANPLEIIWFSVAPFALGPRAADGGGLAVKYKVDSCAADNGEIPDDPGYDYLRDAVKESLNQGEVCLAFWIQPQGDPKDMPIEETLTTWDEQESPFIKVATITIPPQDIDSPGQKAFCEDISFNPWNGLVDHKPLGAINRARKVVMKAISDLRLEQRGVTRTEPNGRERFE